MDTSCKRANSQVLLGGALDLGIDMLIGPHFLTSEAHRGRLWA